MFPVGSTAVRLGVAGGVDDVAECFSGWEDETGQSVECLSVHPEQIASGPVSDRRVDCLVIDAETSGVESTAAIEQWTDQRPNRPVVLLVDGWDDAGDYDALVGLCDLPPTLLDAAGLESPASYRGESLAGLVGDGDWERESVVGGWADDDGRTYVYRDDRWTFVERPGDSPDELYDRDADPGEQHDVAGDHPDRVTAFAARLDEHRAEIRATETDLDGVATDAETVERLRRLGYRE